VLGIGPAAESLDAPLSGYEQARLREILRRACEPDGLAPRHREALDDYVRVICHPPLDRSAGLRAARALLRRFAPPTEPGYVPEPMVVPVSDAAAAHLTPTPDLGRGREPILALLLDLPPSEKTEPMSPLEIRGLS